MVGDDEREPLTGTRRERLRILMQDEIIDAARRIVQERGFKALSMRALGREVGVTAPTLYDYYANKDAVLDALFCAGADRLCQSFAEAIAANPPGLPRLRALAMAYRSFARTDPDLFHLVFAKVDAAYQPSEAVLPHAAAVFALVVETVREGMDLGHLRADDPVAVALATWGMTHGTVMLEITGHLVGCSPSDADIVFARNLDLLYAGLGAASA